MPVDVSLSKYTMYFIYKCYHSNDYVNEYLIFSDEILKVF